MQVSYLIAINLHDQRPSTITAFSICSRSHGHVTVNVNNLIFHNKWVRFAFIGS